MSEAINQPADAAPETTDPGLTEPVSEEERLRGEIGARPLGEVGVLPLGGEIDPSNSAEEPVGEVGEIPGIPIE